MKPGTKAYIAQEGGKLASDLIRIVMARPSKRPATSPESEKEGISPGESVVTPQPPEKVAPSASTGVITREGLEPETMRWQLQEARAELWELEAHLKHYSKECGPDFSCCFKHSQNLIDIARETKSMTTDPIWDDIIKLGEEIRVKAHPDHIRGGTYFAEFPQLVIRVSELRKPIETQLIQLSKPEFTLEEAKQLAAEEAAKEVERRWEVQPSVGTEGNPKTAKQKAIDLMTRLGYTWEVRRADYPRRGPEIEVFPPKGYTFDELTSLLCRSWEEVLERLPYYELVPEREEE